MKWQGFVCCSLLTKSWIENLFASQTCLHLRDGWQLWLKCTTNCVIIMMPNKGNQKLHLIDSDAKSKSIRSKFGVYFMPKSGHEIDPNSDLFRDRRFGQEIDQIWIKLYLYRFWRYLELFNPFRSVLNLFLEATSLEPFHVRGHVTFPGEHIHASIMCILEAVRVNAPKLDG